MRKIWDFHGGIHPETNKEQSTQRGIEKLPLPEELIIPLQQHIGAPAKTLVSVGDHVKKGQKLAEPQGVISAAVHAPTSGTITSIESRPVAHPSAMRDTCVILKPDGQDTWLQAPLNRDHSSLTVSEILTIVRDAGIAGMGGAGFPTEVKLHPPRQDKVKTLILNAAECEPYITADDMLMRERPLEVIKGLEIMARILAPDHCIIGIEDNKPEAIDALRKAAAKTLIEVVVIPTKYPSGGEKQLIKILTGCEIPSGRIPADIGIMCQNVATAAAVYKAVTYGEPLISRVTTATGEAISTPGNYEVLIGTPVSTLLQHAGLQADKVNRLIMGGPMMGFTLENGDCPIVKTSNCIIAATHEEMPLPPPAQACIRCGFCVEACPMELLPQQLFWFAQSGNWEQAENHNLADCIECGACSYVCPSAIPLVQHYRYAKGEIRKQKQDQLKSDKARERFEFRVLRQEREKEEKEANRKARAEAAAKAQAEKKAKELQQGSTPADSKAAAVAAAIARAAEKKALTGNAAASTPAVSQSTEVETAAKVDPMVELSEQESSLEKMKQKLVKLQATLNGMDPANEDAIAKTQRAIEKNQVRVVEAEKAVDALKKTIASKTNAKPETAITETLATDTAVTADAAYASQESVNEQIAHLQDQYDKAKSKCEKMQQTLADAKSSGGDTDKLERALQKNVQRMQQAKESLDQLRASPTATTNTVLTNHEEKSL